MALRVVLHRKLFKVFSTHQVVIFASVVALLLLLFFALGRGAKVVVLPRISTLFTSPVTFDEDLIPSRQDVDVNIGTNYSPLRAQAGRFRILVDPLFDVCEKNTALGVEGQTFFCMAVSDFTGFASFKEYNSQGVSSSLSEVAKGTSHEQFKVIAKRTVLVLEARILFKAIFDRGAIIHRLKLDLQGNELKVLRNIKSFLRANQFHHVMAECFCPIN